MLRIGKIKDLINELIEKYNSGKIKKDKDYKLEISEYKYDKTSAQLSLYNASLREIASKTSQSLMTTRDELHNMFLNEMGLLEYDLDGEPVIQIHKENYQYLKDPTTHLKPTNTIITDNKGEKRRVFYVLRESKTFNTEEFAKLIDLLVRFIIDNDLETKIDISHLQDIVGGK